MSSDERTIRGSSDSSHSTSGEETVHLRNSFDSSRLSSSESKDDQLSSRSSLDGSASPQSNKHVAASRKRSATLALPELKKKDRKKIEKETKKVDKKKAAAISAVPLVHVATVPSNNTGSLLRPKDYQPSKRQKALSVARKPNSPSARCMHASVAIGSEIYVFGGKNQDNLPLKDMFVFDTGTYAIDCKTCGLYLTIPCGRDEIVPSHQTRHRFCSDGSLQRHSARFIKRHLFVIWWNEF